MPKPRQHVGEDADGQHRLQRREAGDRPDLEDVDEHRPRMRKPADLRNDARASRKQIPAHHADADRIGDQRTRGDAAHAELRDRAEAEAERAAENDLAAPPKTRIIIDGNFMLPVPRRMPAIEFISQGSTAPPKKICA